MTEHGDMERFETRFADQVRAYTDPATERRIDALGVSRAAMSSQYGAGRLSQPHRRPFGWAVRPRGDRPDRRGRRRRPGSTVGVRHWPAAVAESHVRARPAARSPRSFVIRGNDPYAVTPGLDEWGSGFLEPDAADSWTSGSNWVPPGSRSAITCRRRRIRSRPRLPTRLRDARSETSALYRWSLDGEGDHHDADGDRAGWMRSPGRGARGAMGPIGPSAPRVAGPLPPGTYLSSAFDPFGESGLSDQLSYTVSEGWKVKDDQPDRHSCCIGFPKRPSSQPPTDLFIALLAQPRMATDFAEGAICAEFEIRRCARCRARGRRHRGSDPGSTRHGVDATGGRDHRRLSMAGCSICISGRPGPEVAKTPQDRFVGMPILVRARWLHARTSRLGHPIRLILLDLSDGRTMSVAVSSVDPSEPSAFAKQLAEAMPVVESFEFHPPMP